MPFLSTMPAMPASYSPLSGRPHWAAAPSAAAPAAAASPRSPAKLQQHSTPPVSVLQSPEGPQASPHASETTPHTQQRHWHSRSLPAPTFSNILAVQHGAPQAQRAQRGGGRQLSQVPQAAPHPPPQDLHSAMC